MLSSDFAFHYLSLKSLIRFEISMFNTCKRIVGFFVHYSVEYYYWHCGFAMYDDYWYNNCIENCFVYRMDIIMPQSLNWIHYNITNRISVPLPLNHIEYVTTDEGNLYRLEDFKPGMNKFSKYTNFSEILMYMFRQKFKNCEHECICLSLEAHNIQNTCQCDRELFTLPLSLS